MTPQEVEAGATVVSAAMSVLAVALAWKANQTAGQARKDILRIDAVLTSLSNSPAYRMTDNATVSYSAGGGSGGNAAPGGIGGGGGGGGSIFGPGGSGGSGAAG